MHQLKKHQLTCNEKSILRTGKFSEVEIEVLKRQLRENSNEVVETVKKKRKAERKKEKSNRN